MAVLTGIGRIFAGVHDPADIAGGALIAWIAAMMIVRFERRLSPLVEVILKLYRTCLPFPLIEDKSSFPGKGT